MDEISVKGKKYLKAKVIARELGYTNDYVGQLCRAGKVDAELVGRTWYVDPDSIKGHKKTRYRSAKTSTQRELREHVERNLKEADERQKNAVSVHLKGTGKKTISYSSDETDLIPSPSQGQSTKLSVGLADAKKVKVSTEGKTDTTFSAPEREKTKFFGTLRVTDFIDELPVDGEDDEPQRLSVQDVSDEPQIIPVPKTEEEPPEEVEPVKVTTSKRPTRKRPQPPQRPPSLAMPVTVDEEEVPLPIIYRVAPVTAAVTGLAISSVLLGLETNIVATSDALSATYAFVAENVSALIYIAK